MALATAGSFLCATANGAGPVPDHASLARRLAACAICHGKQGQGDLEVNGDVYPRLAGQPAGYLFSQIVRFQAARRVGIPPVTIMQRLLDNLPQDYLHRIADFYASSAPPFPPKPHSTRAELKLGREVVTQGLPLARVAPCTSCHGEALTGRPPDIPALAGQYAGYLWIQFAHWQQGARHNRRHEHIAAALTEAQLAAVVDYLASLRPPESQP